jgi:hypothetical protein
MAISTLSKFTVPLANDQSSASQGLLMPKLQYRFRAILENFEYQHQDQNLQNKLLI